MAALSQGIIGGEMAWPLVIVGIAMGISMILIKVRSPMLFSVGMYLPLGTTFAIFMGGIIRGIVDRMIKNAVTMMLRRHVWRMQGFSLHPD